MKAAMMFSRSVPPGGGRAGADFGAGARTLRLAGHGGLLY